MINFVNAKLLHVVFYSAAAYNIAWGATAVLFPNLLFDLFGLAHLNYPFVMSGLGMCIGLYGYGYWVVARDLRKYPQLVFIGLLGKILGPIGWAYTVYTTSLPLRTMWMNVFNDFIWIPFFLIYFVWYIRFGRLVSPSSQR